MENPKQKDRGRYLFLFLIGQCPQPRRARHTSRRNILRFFKYTTVFNEEQSRKKENTRGARGVRWTSNSIASKQMRRRYAHACAHQLVASCNNLFAFSKPCSLPMPNISAISSKRISVSIASKAMVCRPSLSSSSLRTRT